MEEEKSEKGLSEPAWYYKPWAIGLAIIGFGPLGLIPLWFRPKTSLVLKIGISVLVLYATVWMTLGATQYYADLVEYVGQVAGTTAN